MLRKKASRQPDHREWVSAACIERVRLKQIVHQLTAGSVCNRLEDRAGKVHGWRLLKQLRMVDDMQERGCRYFSSAPRLILVPSTCNVLPNTPSKPCCHPADHAAWGRPVPACFKQNAHTQSPSIKHQHTTDLASLLQRQLLVGVGNPCVLCHHLSVAPHHPFAGQQALNPYRATRMDAAGTDANLRA